MALDSIYERVLHKSYKISINGIECYVRADSLGHALRKVGDLCLQESDVILVSREKE